MIADHSDGLPQRQHVASIPVQVGAILMADIAHISGLVATGEHPSPFEQPNAQILYHIVAVAVAIGFAAQL